MPIVCLMCGQSILPGFEGFTRIWATNIVGYFACPCGYVNLLPKEFSCPNQSNE